MIEVRGVKFPAYMDQIDFPYFKRFTEKKLQPVKKEKVFVDSFAYTNVSSPANEPEKIVKMPYSFSSVGLNIGLQYQF